MFSSGLEKKQLQIGIWIFVFAIFVAKTSLWLISDHLRADVFLGLQKNPDTKLVSGFLFLQFNLRNPNCG